VSPALDIRPQARRDVNKIAADLDDCDPAVSARFLADVRTAFDRLTTFPSLGPLWHANDPAHADKRRLVLRTFPVSIFYRASETTITIVRVLHQARDIPPLLEGL
jgi:plasmid stabilization system protein ParE